MKRADNGKALETQRIERDMGAATIVVELRGCRKVPNDVAGRILDHLYQKFWEEGCDLLEKAGIATIGVNPMN